MRYLAELKEGEMVKEIYLCKKLQALKTKAGKSYYSLTLQDKTGVFDAKVWELGAGIEHFEVMDYICIDGQVTSFQNALQLNIKRVRKCQEGEYDPADYMPMTTRNIDEMYRELLELIAMVKEPHLQELLQSFFVRDKDFAARFKRHSAAKAVHHGFIGGLLEHTLGVAKLCAFFADTYEILNKDLLLTAAVFHDMGKMEEISPFPENDYTDDGNLLGHIYIGASQISARCRTIEGFSKRLEGELIHCILAHHGELEFGSPKKPALAEALALYIADNADAKMETLKEIFGAADPKLEWVGYQRLLESNLKRTLM